MTDRSNGSSAKPGGAARARTAARPDPAKLARRAAAELSELLGREPEGIVSLESHDNGWQIGVEVVETRRIPDTSDVLAEYEVQVDRAGRMTGYRRVRRYARGRLEDG